jgi:hypothetical protein
LGPQANKSKEAQAAIKNLETNLAAYKSNTLSLGSSYSHKLVLEIENLKSSCAVVRIEAGDISVELISIDIQKEVNIHHGIIGWLNESSGIVSDPENLDSQTEEIKSNNVHSNNGVAQIDSNETDAFQKLSESDQNILLTKSEKVSEFHFKTMNNKYLNI